MNALLPWLILSFQDREVQRLSRNAILVSAMPASADVRAAMGAFMATQQAKQSIVEQQRAVELALGEDVPGIVIAAADVVTAARKEGAQVTEDRVLAVPKLAPFATADVVSALNAAADAGLCPDQVDVKALDQVVVLATIIMNTKQFPATEDWHKVLPDLAALLGAERVAEITHDAGTALAPTRTRTPARAKAEGGGSE
ncbi:MAG TPA: hypothetical protein VGX25_02040 [Actinophytocola sp.]|uniref:hypothetical protein n=1 Tax=Actinophytocola sp. TaxID=1872138 RepID=UPI002DDDA94C|nr:hypothetical protein [Actinophytocola sp.]HEV2778159.1 hypothetical protein [Actinophytocola sp.]